MFQVLQQRHFSDGCTGSSLLVLKTDLLERHHGVRQPGLALVDRGVGSLKYVKFLMSFSEFDGFLTTP